MFRSIPTYKNDKWSETVFETQADWVKFLRSQVKSVGEYNLTNTHLWRKEIIRYEETGSYCRHVKGTKSYTEYWEFEKRKSLTGVIIEGFYITPHYYFFLNFCPIYNVLEQETTPAEVWDSQYDYTLKAELAYYRGEHIVVVKKRRWGYSLLEVADIHRIFIFQRDSICKFIHKDEDPNEKNFRILDSYREFTNLNTGWYRGVMGNTGKSLEQKIQKTDLATGKKSYSGRMSVVESVVTKQNPAKGVGLYLTKAFYDEAGINNSVIKSVQYNEKAAKQGGVLKGKIVAGGSVGELKDCESLKELIYNPSEYGFFGEEDVTGKKYGIFIPENYNYIQEVRDDEGLVIDIIKHYDKDGNSFLKAAKTAIKQARLLEKGKSPQAYRLSISQGPLSLSEAFDEREENIFPTSIINPVYESLFAVKESLGIPVELFRDNQDKLKHRVVKNTKVFDFPVEKTTQREGCIIIHEFPKPNPPVGLFFAAVDPVGIKKTSSDNTKSLMSVYIMKARHQLEDEYGEKCIVAEYCGRHDDFENTYRIVSDLCEFYNARTLVENNNENYIQWLITQKKQKLLIRKSELNNLKDVVPTYSNTADYGVSMNKDLKVYLMDLIVSYLEVPITKEFDDRDATSRNVTGVNLIKDPMLLKEALKWTPKLNTDRLIAFSLCLWIVNLFSEQLHRVVRTKQDNYVPKKRGMFNTATPMFNKVKMF